MAHGLLRSAGMRAVLAAWLVVAGCSGPKGTPHAAPDSFVCPTISVSLRDPEHNLCTTLTGCDATEDKRLALDWAPCQDNCPESEAECIVTPGCRATYLRSGAARFMACVAVAPSGPVHGPCPGLASHECSRHDDCSMLYIQRSDHPHEYAGCFDQPAPVTPVHPQ